VLGLAEPTTGRIEIGDVDFAGCNVEGGASRRVGPQHPTIFRGTVSDNIRIGDATATEDAVRAAAIATGGTKSCAASTTVTTRWSATETCALGGRAAPYRRRTRARPGRTVGVFDEPTADPIRQRQLIATAIAELRGRHAVLLIAHRRSSSLADRVVMLAAGKLVDSDLVAA
jgi:ABC-type transport system involved in cytochrome bd biosynthesis fused ATPase/permease subunit